MPGHQRGFRPRRRGQPGSRGFGTSFAALIVSAVGHLVVGIILLELFLSEPVPPDPAGEVAITVRLLKPPPPPDPKPEPPAPDPPRVPAPEPPPAPTPTVNLPPDPGPPAPAEAPAGASEPDTPPEALDTPPERTLPAVAGLGMRPPPLDVGADGAPGTYAGRSEGKARLLRLYGGDGSTENAVSRGLRWLAAHQDADGAWDPNGFSRHCGHNTPCKGRGLAEFTVGVTSLAVLAFLGSGHHPEKAGPYGRHVRQGIDYLASSQGATGAFGSEGRHYLYNHALATFALAEAFGVTGDRRIARRVALALRFSRGAQQSGGGWDYTSERTGRNDLSITGWQILAIRAARSVGIEVPGGLRTPIRSFLSQAFTTDGLGVYADRDPDAGRLGINMVAVALLAHLTTGGSPADPRVRRAVDRLLSVRDRPDPEAFRSWDSTFQSYYHWYTATLALFHLGETRYWKAWNNHLKRTLVPLQVVDSHAGGSWSPETNWVGSSGGRVYATAINVLTLEVYYRYEPLHGTRPR